MPDARPAASSASRSRRRSRPATMPVASTPRSTALASASPAKASRRERAVRRRSKRGGGFDLQDLAIFLFVGVPIVGAVLTGIFGRKLGSLLTGGAVGGIGWWLTTSPLVAAGAGLVALFLVGVMGVGAAAVALGAWRPGHLGRRRWRRGPGWSEAAAASRPGGGGDFGGGGASGRSVMSTPAPPKAHRSASTRFHEPLGVAPSQTPPSRRARCAASARRRRIGAHRSARSRPASAATAARSASASKPACL